MSHARFHTLSLVLVLGLIVFSHAVMALPDDALIGLNFSPKIDQHVVVTVGFESVGGTVSHAPNLAEGGYAKPQNKPRYQSGYIGFNWQLSKRLRFDGRLQKREFTFKRDQYQFHLYSLGLQYLLPKNRIDRQYIFSFGVASNQAAILDKNSYSNYDEKILTSVQIHQPYDVQVQSNIATIFELTPSIKSSLFVGVGYAYTEHSKITGIGKNKEGCRYQFEVGGGSGSLEQLGVCGNILQFSQQYPSYQIVKDNLGFNPVADIKSQAYYWQAGGNAQWDYGRFDASVGYFYQRYDRGDFDDRIQQRGSMAVTDNHTLVARLNYHHSDRLSLSVQAEYNEQQFLNQLPVLYTGVTSARFAKDVAYFSLSMSYVIRSGQ